MASKDVPRETNAPRAEDIVNTIREGLLVLDADLRVQAASASFYEKFGVAPEETEGRLVYELGNGQWDIPELRQLFEDVLPDNQVFNGYRVTHTFEHIGERTMLLNARRLDGVQKILLAIEDVTERERAETEATEATFRQLFENIPGRYLIVRPAGYEIVAASDAYLRATMTERADILGKTLCEVFPADSSDPDAEDVRRLRASLERVKTEGEADVMPVTRYPIPRRAAGAGEFEERWWSPVNSPVFNASGEVDYIIHRVEDVTPVVRKLQTDGEEGGLLRLDTADLRLAADIILRGQELHRAKEHAYEQLRASEARYRSLVESIDEGFCVIEMLFDADARPIDYRFLETNPAFAKLTGLTDAEGKRMRELAPDHEANWFETYGRVATTGASIRFVAKAEHLGRRWYDVYAFRVGQPEERKVALLFNDVTERRRAEEERKQLTETLEERVRERTEQLRDLAERLTVAEQEERRRIAHVLHDHIQQILFGAEMSVRQMGRTVRQVDDTDVRAEQGRYLHQLEEMLGEAIQQTRRLSVELSPPVLQQEGLVAELTWLGRHVEEAHGLDVDLQVEPGVGVSGSAERILLFRVARELLSNVVLHAGVDCATIEVYEASGRPVLRVTDRGRGFDPSVIGQQKTTEGFGLAAIRERLELLGGRLEIASGPGQGTRVTAYVPTRRSE